MERGDGLDSVGDAVQDEEDFAGVTAEPGEELEEGLVAFVGFGDGNGLVVETDGFVMGDAVSEVLNLNQELKDVLLEYPKWTVVEYI